MGKRRRLSSGGPARACGDAHAVPTVRGTAAPTDHPQASPDRRQAARTRHVGTTGGGVSEDQERTAWHLGPSGPTKADHFARFNALRDCGWLDGRLNRPQLALWFFYESHAKPDGTPFEVVGDEEIEKTIGCGSGNLGRLRDALATQVLIEVTKRRSGQGRYWEVRMLAPKPRTADEVSDPKPRTADEVSQNAPYLCSASKTAKKEKRARFVRRA